MLVWQQNGVKGSKLKAEVFVVGAQRPYHGAGAEQLRRGGQPELQRRAHKPGTKINLIHSVYYNNRLRCVCVCITAPFFELMYCVRE